MTHDPTSYVGAVHFEAAESFRTRFEHYIGDGPGQITAATFSDLAAVAGWLAVYGGCMAKVARAMGRSRPWAYRKRDAVEALIRAELQMAM